MRYHAEVATGSARKQVGQTDAPSISILKEESLDLPGNLYELPIPLRQKYLEKNGKYPPSCLLKDTEKVSQ